ncbi:MAG: WYL domain-containing protein [Bacteroidales bacterium]|jgi:predicted DNA-binding transcriptional regulator YafY|nr:WYL domain-containing protein [Bacteroidales bacterium]
MPNKNTTRRDSLIIQRILRNDYPSRETLLKYLREHGADIGIRTFQRDIENISSNFDIDITYDRQKQGWTINTETTAEVDKLLYFVRLVAASNVVLHSLKDKHELLKYLSFIPNTVLKGIEHINVLLSAIRARQTVQFAHLNYDTGMTKTYTAEPYLLKEFEGRWYLFAYVRQLAGFRTFGLDRISDLTVSGKKFKREKALEQTADKFDEVYGLVYMPEQQHPPIEKVTLRFSDIMIKHVQALPLHYSQTTKKGIVTLRLIINRELENKLLSYGEHMEVLTPGSLRKRIKQRLTETLQHY